jgi:hypothetical protein
MDHELIDTSETDAIACIAPTRFTRARDLDDLTTPQTIITGDRICHLYPRELCLLQTAAILSGRGERTGAMGVSRTIAPIGASFVLYPESHVLAPVCDVLYSPIGRLQRILPA